MQHSSWRAPIYSPFSCKPFAVFSANIHLVAGTPVLWFDLLAIFLLRLHRTCFSQSSSLQSFHFFMSLRHTLSLRRVTHGVFSRKVSRKWYRASSSQYSSRPEALDDGRYAVWLLRNTSNTSKHPVRRTLLRIWRLGYPQHDHQMYPLYRG